MSLCPTLVTGGTRALGKVLFPRRSVRVESARRNTQGLCPILLPPLPRTLDTSQFLQHQSGEGAFIHRWDDPKEGSWRWEPDHRETWTHRAFQSSSSPEASHPLGAVGVFHCRRVLLDLEVVGPCGGEQAHQVHGAGLIGWHILPGSVSPVTVHPWEASLPRLQGCDSSPGHQGLRGIESEFSL